MDHSFAFLIFCSLIVLQSRASDLSSSTVFFIDSPTHNYLRHPSSYLDDSISLPEISAAVSALLGVAPASTLSLASSTKLNKILLPNPFDRPHAIFMLEITKSEGSQILINTDNNIFGSALKSKVSAIDTQANIQLPGEDVSVNYLNDEAEYSDKEISEFASLLGGSYKADALKPLNGELVIPLESGTHLQLHLSKNADKKFTTNLVSFISNIQKAIENQKDNSQSLIGQSELITGKFDGIKALEENYGTEGVTQQGIELLVTSVSKMFNLLQTAYKGEIVGIVVYSGESSKDAKNILNVEISSRPSRFLQQTDFPINITTIAQVVLVRTSIAWITGIILLIATFMGTCCLLNMPLTRDTLLYSNVKLD